MHSEIVGIIIGYNCNGNKYYGNRCKMCIGYNCIGYYFNGYYCIVNICIGYYCYGYY